MAITYKEAGVYIEGGDALVDWLIESDHKDKTPTPHKDKIVSGIGGFAALFRARFTDMQSPCLVSSTDGVGTKVKLAAEFARYEGIGQDLVAMCVNDLACTGAEPLFFLDYYASAKLDLKAAKVFLEGVRRACHESGCALIGGETAEMPGVYHDGDFDCAGFAVGVVDEPKALGPLKVQAGDRIIGVESSGFHSNGYSLVRKLFADDMKKWLDVLLKPTHLYSALVQKILRVGDIHAVAHITGGGLDNILRVVPDGHAVELKPWSVPSVFKEAKTRAKIDWPQMLRTFNCGVGLTLIVAAKDFEKIKKTVGEAGYAAYDLGEVVVSHKKEWRLDTAKLSEKVIGER